MRANTVTGILSRSVSILRSPQNTPVSKTIQFHTSPITNHHQKFSTQSGHFLPRCHSLTSSLIAREAYRPQTIGILRRLSTGKPETPSTPKEADALTTSEAKEALKADGFGRSEKASKAAQVNLSARLHKEGATLSGKASAGEIIRLLKIARPEAKWLGGLSLEFHATARNNELNISSCFRRFYTTTILFGYHHVCPVRITSNFETFGTC